MDINGLHIPTLMGACASATATFGFVYGLFSRFEKLQSRKNRRFLAHWLLGLKLPQRDSQDFFVELFDKLFGPRHLSLRCAAVSSILTTALVSVAVFVIWLRSSFRMGAFLFQETITWLPCAYLVDYLSLWKTRLILTKVLVLRNMAVSLITIFVDFVFTSVMYFLMFYIFVVFGQYYLLGMDLSLQRMLNQPVSSFLGFVSLKMQGIAQPLDSLTMLLYFVALMTSAWLWAYLFSSQLMRFLVNMPRFLQLLSKIVDLEEHPVRVLGFVAATLTSTVVIFLSVI